MNVRTKIAIIVPELLPVPPTQGGAVETWVHEISKHFKLDNYEISIFSRPTTATDTDITYHYIRWSTMDRVFNKIKNRCSKKNPLRHIAKIQNVYAYSNKISRILKKKSFDIIYIHNEPNLINTLKFPKGSRVVLHMHNNHLCDRALRFFYKKTIKKTDKVIFVSQFLRNEAEKIFPQYKNKFTTIYNGTDTELFKPYDRSNINELLSMIKFDNNCKYILYTGRLNHDKGVHILIEAFKIVNKMREDLKLIICGTSWFKNEKKDKYTRHLEKIASPVKDSIIFTGFLSHDLLCYLYSAVDIFVFPALWQEPFGLVLIEAMAAETFVIASNVGAIPEIFRNEDPNTLFPSGNITELVKKLIYYLDNGEIRKQMAKALRHNVINNFTWEKVYNNVTSTFEELL
ncbi:MAG: glycosyltransferase family 4 protein [Spirochaetales bacterium]|nr:glycosyltransferase family 4 protein [Spirochaetales bacterium]